MIKIQLVVYKLLFLVLATAILYVGKPFLIPVALAGVLATLFVGIAKKLETWGLNRALSSLIGVLLIVLAFATIIALLVWRLSNFSENLEGMQEQVLNLFERLKAWIDQTLGISSDQQEALVNGAEQSIGNGGGTSTLLTFASGTMSILVDSVLVLVYTFLFLFYRSRIKNFILKLVDNAKKDRTEKIIYKSVDVSKNYLAGLALMIAMLWILYGVGFSVVGVENALFFAVLCGILEIVPFVGNITGTSLTVLATVAQGGASDKIIGVIIVYLAVQFVQTYILEPLVVGDQVNINPLFTIIALVLGELIWGIGGMVLAIPLLGIIKIICDNVPALQPFGYLIGTDRKKKKSFFRFR
ncbi:AI-2E family transporter [Olivibacter sp. SA151]|uniref:AI-2E family transporter n=1 Tax=Olivibacter jilunii TaxID=985016 RepID=UPI003F18DBE8